MTLYSTDITQNIHHLQSQIPPHVNVVAVSKFQSVEKIRMAYEAGHKDFGENYVQELLSKQPLLPQDIQWHFIGHLQTNKVKYIAPFIHLIHSVDSMKLLHEINKQAEKHHRVIHCLLQIHIASESTKFGLTFDEALQILNHNELPHFQNITIYGLMGMATYTNDTEQIRKEFLSLKNFFDELFAHISLPNVKMHILSMGMSNDYQIAIQCGSNMIRIGTMIFGERKKN